MAALSALSDKRQPGRLRGELYQRRRRQKEEANISARQRWRRARADADGCADDAGGKRVPYHAAPGRSASSRRQLTRTKMRQTFCFQEPRAAILAARARYFGADDFTKAEFPCPLAVAI